MEKYKTTTAIYDSYSELGKAFLVADRKGLVTNSVIWLIFLLIGTIFSSLNIIVLSSIMLFINLFGFAFPSSNSTRITDLTKRAKIHAKTYLWTVPKRKENEYSFTTSFGEKEFIIRDTLEYNKNDFLRIPYSDITHCVETKRFFVIISNISFNSRFWLFFFPLHDSLFGMVDKLEIEKSGQMEEFIEFLSDKCEKIKFDFECHKNR